MDIEGDVVRNVKMREMGKHVGVYHIQYVDKRRGKNGIVSVAAVIVPEPYHILRCHVTCVSTFPVFAVHFAVTLVLDELLELVFVELELLAFCFVCELVFAPTLVLPTVMVGISGIEIEGISGML